MGVQSGLRIGMVLDATGRTRLVVQMIGMVILWHGCHDEGLFFLVTSQVPSLLCAQRHLCSDLGMIA